MNYLSVCSGIEAATVGWHSLGWKPVAFSEIEPFPCAALAHHYPNVPNWGDMTKFKEWPDAAIDVLVGGTPCQSFSVAGLRKGLDDPRGNLMLTYLAIAAKYRPRWLVWENVPGVLSSNGGNDFASFLRGLGECGYGFAYRILDAQHFGVPQRRRRVFVVGHLGNWQRAAAVLFERHSLQGHPAPRREAGQGFTHPIAPSLTSSGRGVERGGDTRGQDPVVAIARSVAIRGRDGVPQVELGDDKANAILTPNGGRGGVGVGAVLTAARMVAFGEYVEDDTASAMKQRDYKDATDMVVSHALRGEGFDASEDGTGRGTPIIPILEVGKGSSSRGAGPNGMGIGKDGDPTFTLQAGAQHAVGFAQNQRDEVRTVAGALAAEPGAKQQTYIAFSAKDHGADASADVAPTLRAGGHSKSHANAGVMPAVAFNQSGDIYAGTQEADSSSILSTLRDRLGKKAVAEWGSRILDSLQSPEILRAWLHGQGLRCSASNFRSFVDDCPLPREEGEAARTMRIVWENGPDGRSSQGRGLAKQLAHELGKALPQLPYPLASEPPSMQVRRLTPKECSRLQGFADDYLDVNYRGKPAADGPRYKALGNSMAVPVMAWIGKRIQQVEEISCTTKQKYHSA